MKLFIVLCIVIAAAAAQTLTAEQTAKLKEHFKVCLGSSAVDAGLVTKARAGDFSTEDAKLDTFFDCMFKRIGFMDDAGMLKPDVIKTKVPSGVSGDDVTKVLQACSAVTSLPANKRAIGAYKCYLTEAPVKIQLFPEA